MRARGKGSSPGKVEGSSRAMLATARRFCSTMLTYLDLHLYFHLRGSRSNASVASVNKVTVLSHVALRCGAVRYSTAPYDVVCYRAVPYGAACRRAAQ